jgi:hypothetical protein
MRETGRRREPMYSVKHGLHNPQEAGHGRSATYGAENDIIGVTRFVCMRLAEKTVVRTSWQIGYYNIMSMLLQAKTSPAVGKTWAVFGDGGCFANAGFSPFFLSVSCFPIDFSRNRPSANRMIHGIDRKRWPLVSTCSAIHMDSLACQHGGRIHING